ncbi:hypothetical protein [Micromonospora sp. LH3U1]|uniref:hypothetical protein n=1 Tax=Micromonospora sp. LH3U1 TaxID=3018339 RepID=UPI002349FB51|nr:hypothetical protein [Micromonospora sp. LH3U1]WCN79300.1 hypothetical protein PCA76_20005 [Micromonospora sp. LH3U1]
MSRPLLLLDIDGVLNPYGSPQPPVGYTEHRLFPGAWITEASTVLDIAWATPFSTPQEPLRSA